MGNKVSLLQDIAIGIHGIASAIDVLTNAIIALGKTDMPTTVVDFHRVIWLDSVGKYVLIWYADGTGQILKVEGQVQTLSTVNRDGKTCYKLTDGRELTFPREELKVAVSYER